MAYSDFTLPEVTKRFQLTLDEQQDPFAPVEEVSPGAFLRTALEENIPPV